MDINLLHLQPISLIVPNLSPVAKYVNEKSKINSKLALRGSKLQNRQYFLKYASAMKGNIENEQKWLCVFGLIIPENIQNRLYYQTKALVEF